MIDRLPGLHALRAVAAFQVFVLHTTLFSKVVDQPVWLFVASYFNLGVQLFYVVSAFALMHSTRVYASEPDWLYRFATKRFWRIAPLFYVMMVVTAIYSYYAHHNVPTPPEIVLNLLFLNNLVPKWASSMVFAGWSVSVEMMFYAIFPLAFLYIRSLKAATVFLIVSIVVGEISRFYLQRIPMVFIGTYADFSALPQLQFFAFGMFAFFGYELLKRTQFGTDTSMRAALTYHAVFFSAALGLLVLVALFNDTLRPFLRIDMVIWGLFFALITVWFTVRDIPPLSWAPFQFLGERSYSLYLVHVIMVICLVSVTRSVFSALQPTMGMWAFLPALIATYIPIVALATLTYAFIEKPGMNLGRRLRNGPKANAVAVGTN